MSKIRAITPVNIVTKRNMPSYVTIVITSLSGATANLWRTVVIITRHEKFVNIYEDPLRYCRNGSLFMLCFSYPP